MFDKVMGVFVDMVDSGFDIADSVVDGFFTDAQFGEFVAIGIRVMLAVRCVRVFLKGSGFNALVDKLSG